MLTQFEYHWCYLCQYHYYSACFHQFASISYTEKLKNPKVALRFWRVMGKISGINTLATLNAMRREQLVSLHFCIYQVFLKILKKSIDLQETSYLTIKIDKIDKVSGDKTVD